LPEKSRREIRLHLLNPTDSLFIERFDARNVYVDGKRDAVVARRGRQRDEFVELVKTPNPEKAIVEETRVKEFKGRVRTSTVTERLTKQLSKILAKIGEVSRKNMLCSSRSLRS